MEQVPEVTRGQRRTRHDHDERFAQLTQAREDSGELTEGRVGHHLLAQVGCWRAGLLELKRRAWLGGLDWKALIRKEIPAPVVPVLEHDKDTSNYEKYVETDDPEPATSAGTSGEWAVV